eukprot:COSAG02_NODE_8617_length_2503_cov_6.137271_6_plen_57_part_01
MTHRQLIELKFHRLDALLKGSLRLRILALPPHKCFVKVDLSRSVLVRLGKCCCGRLT